jgi:hypothetical protein
MTCISEKRQVVQWMHGLVRNTRLSGRWLVCHATGSSHSQGRKGFTGKSSHMRARCMQRIHMLACLHATSLQLCAQHTCTRSHGHTRVSMDRRTQTHTHTPTHPSTHTPPKHAHAHATHVHMHAARMPALMAQSMGAHGHRGVLHKATLQSDVGVTE